MVYSYRTRGTCPRQIDAELDGDITKSLQVQGGCHGHRPGLSAIVRGKTIEEVEKAFSGIRCGMKPTSCPDQLVQALHAAKTAQEAG